MKNEVWVSRRMQEHVENEDRKSSTSASLGEAEWEEGLHQIQVLPFVSL